MDLPWSRQALKIVKIMKNAPNRDPSSRLWIARKWARFQSIQRQRAHAMSISMKSGKDTLRLAKMGQKLHLLESEGVTTFENFHDFLAFEYWVRFRRTSLIGMQKLR